MSGCQGLFNGITTSLSQKRAMDWFDKQGLAFLGFKHSTALISIMAGVLFYASIKIAFAVPDKYLLFSIPSLVLVFGLIALTGLLVSGNVPARGSAIKKYCKRFVSPSVTGLGLALGTSMIDFLINAT